MKAFYHPLILILIYLIAHLLIRIIFNDSIQVDDREQILVAQDLLLGYDMPQPPLYSWLAYFIFKVFGANLYALTLLKYSLISSVGNLFFLATNIRTSSSPISFAFVK